jgi:small-conductance mechanosensitive channel
MAGASQAHAFELQQFIAPVQDSVRDTLERWARALPLVLAACSIFLLVSFVGHLIASRTSVWNRMTSNPFLAQIIAQAIRVVGILLGILLALNLLGATALMGTILGSAGVVGLAISFGVKDTIENYIASIMLSVRQPFRAQDHVVINDLEGIVVRLTSRSTVVMTLDGNHLRIPNRIVYQSPILNYTRNPQRRFDFVLGVDAEDDPAQAMSVGVQAIHQLD